VYFEDKACGTPEKVLPTVVATDVAMPYITRERPKEFLLPTPALTIWIMMVSPTTTRLKPYEGASDDAEEKMKGDAKFVRKYSIPTMGWWKGYAYCEGPKVGVQPYE
jgi:hypothetical protein